MAVKRAWASAAAFRDRQLFVSRVLIEWRGASGVGGAGKASSFSRSNLSCFGGPGLPGSAASTSAFATTLSSSSSVRGNFVDRGADRNRVYLHIFWNVTSQLLWITSIPGRTPILVAHGVVLELRRILLDPLDAWARVLVRRAQRLARDILRRVALGNVLRDRGVVIERESHMYRQRGHRISLAHNGSYMS